MKTIKEYIKECNEGKLSSSLYTTTNEDGQKVIVELQKGSGAKVSTLQSNGWYEVAYYDENGEIEFATYEKGNDEKWNYKGKQYFF